MISKNLKSINNIFQRFQDYDKTGIKYTFDILYTTIHSSGEYVKVKRQQGADVFDRNIKELSENYDGVATITVSDYCGKAGNARRINPPVIIDLTEVSSDGQTSQPSNSKEINSEQGKPVNDDVMQGLSGFLSGTEFAGFGNFAPVAKFMDDKHTIERLREKYNEQTERFLESERKILDLTAKLQSLSNDYERLKADADEMDEELEYYQSKEQKQTGMMDMIGLAGASIAKTFLRQNPSILSGIIPAEQLSGILSENVNDMEPAPENDLSEEDQQRLDKVTSMFEWVQAMDNPLFEEVFSIMTVIHQQPAYARHIIHALSGRKQ